jgi:hypothetical protein
MRYYFMPVIAKLLLPCIELVDICWMRTMYTYHGFVQKHHLWNWPEWIYDWPNEFLETKRGHQFHAWLCGWNGHSGVVWYNPSGYEPCMDCKRCGEDLG